MGKPKRANKMRDVKEKKEFEEEVLQIDRVTRVVKGGRRLRFRATVIIGNRKGKVGIGLGKASEVAEAIKKAVAQAKKEIIQVPTVNDTVAFEIKDKFKAARLLMRPAKEGTGIIAGSATRRILELAGVKNVVAKSLGSTNKINLAKATIKALKQYSMREIKVPQKKQESKNPEAKKLEQKKDTSSVVPQSNTKVEVDKKE